MISTLPIERSGYSFMNRARSSIVESIGKTVKTNRRTQFLPSFLKSLLFFPIRRVDRAMVIFPAESSLAKSLSRTITVTLPSSGSELLPPESLHLEKWFSPIDHSTSSQFEAGPVCKQGIIFNRTFKNFITEPFD